mmetsp:Transcript_22826/g.58107  ORF Transcript_22826/g.58107 Transcript_22826/m.58107 type:complete len:441 (-) Transcript_22826:118-1440(-)
MRQQSESPRHIPSSPSSITSSRSSTRHVLGDTGPRKITPAKKTEELFQLVKDFLVQEWQCVRSLNLGVKSGTGMVDEIILRRVATWVAELHMLCISHETAADALGRLARRLNRDQLQQFQVLCDTTGHEYLSDFVRLCVYNTSEPFAKQAVDVVAGRRGAQRKRSQSADMGQAKGPLTQPYMGPRPERDEFIRFAGYLPPEHPLVQGAYRLYLSRLPPEEVPQQQDEGAHSSVDDWSLEQLNRALAGRTLGSTQHDKDAQHDKLPLYGDVEARWRATNHTVIRDEVFNPIVVGDPLPLYASMPDYKKKHMEKLEADKAAEKAAAQAALGPMLNAGRVPRTMQRQPSTLNSPVPRAGSINQVPGTPGSTRPTNTGGGAVPLPSLTSQSSSPAPSNAGSGTSSGEGPTLGDVPLPSLPMLAPSATMRESRFKPQSSVTSQPG